MVDVPKKFQSEEQAQPKAQVESKFELPTHIETEVISAVDRLEVKTQTQTQTQVQVQVNLNPEDEIVQTEVDFTKLSFDSSVLALQDGDSGRDRGSGTGWGRDPGRQKGGGGLGYGRRRVSGRATPPHTHPHGCGRTMIPGS